jgi:hypothetical protein
MQLDAPVRARALAADQDWLISARQALSCGLSRQDVRALVRRREWLAVTRGIYVVDADLYGAGLPQRMWWRAALLTHGTQSYLVGPTALRAHGVAGLVSDETTIEIAVPDGVSVRRRQTTDPRPTTCDGPMILVRQLVVPPDQVVARDGLRVRAIVPSLADVGLIAARPVGLSLLDSALHLGLIGPDDLRQIELFGRGRRGAVKLRSLLGLADGRAESPLESRVRLACIDGNLPPNQLQYPVYDGFGNLLAIGDFAWLSRPRPLIGEADGESVHALPRAVYRDRWRGNALTARGCDTIRFTWADAMEPRRIVSAVRAALAA